ncbi:MAG: NUDIX hydrolase [Actinobacteria bacterium]|nr:MAG: NUDIX hydrolase [Actinomycetota bacterium]
MKTRSEFSAGGVVFRKARQGPEVVLAARRTRKGDLAWGLPKGLVEPGENPVEAAVREVQEETGLQGEIVQPLGEISYWFVWGGERVRKRVAFFLMQAVGGDTSLHDHEMEDVRWFPLAEALSAASYPSERQVIRRAAEALDGSP